MLGLEDVDRPDHPRGFVVPGRPRFLLTAMTWATPQPGVKIPSGIFSYTWILQVAKWTYLDCPHVSISNPCPGILVLRLADMVGR